MISVPFRRRRGPRGLCPAVVSAVLALACTSHERPPQPPVPVTVAVAETRPVPYVLEASGTVEPLGRVNVEAQITGLLLRVGFHEGDEVAKGQVLFEIDPRPYQAALSQAEAALARDQAQAENAERDAGRYAALVKQEYVTSQQYETAVATAAALRATLQGDSAAMETARLNLRYATVRAPITGRTGNLMIREGNLVRGPGTTLVTINQVHPILVRFAVPGSALADLRKRPATEIMVEVDPAGGGPTETGRLAFIDNAVDSTTGTILLKGSFPNTAGALWPGQYVSVRVQLYVEQAALTIPARALISGQQGTTVFVVDSAGRASARSVTVERTAGDAAVISGGLTAGERVVTQGQLRLFPGATVEVQGDTPAAVKADS